MKRFIATWQTKNKRYGDPFDETDRHASEYAVSELLNALRSYGSIDITTLKVTEEDVTQSESDD